MNIGGKDRRLLVKFVETMQALMTFDIGKEVKANLKALENATVDAQEAEQKAADREKAAQTAETSATVARQKLADESATAERDLGKRESSVAERERAVGEIEIAHAAQDKNLARREKLLRKAGVSGL
jgi:hypothetical protein